MWINHLTKTKNNMTPREQAALSWPIEKAFAEGKDVEFQTPSGKWESTPNPSFNRTLNWRIKTEPKLRQFKPEEVPVGALYKSSSCPLPKLILCCDDNSYVLAGSEWCWVENMTHGLYSYDHGSPWLPFGVVE